MIFTPAASGLTGPGTPCTSTVWPETGPSRRRGAGRLGSQGRGDLGGGVERDGGERPIPFGHQIQEAGGIGRLPGDRPPPPARPGRRRRRGRAGAATGGDRAFLQDPGAEPGQGGGWGQGQAQQPQGQAAEDGQRGGRVGAQGHARLLVAGEGPGADDALCAPD
jgi:hypothetical protein